MRTTTDMMDADADATRCGTRAAADRNYWEWVVEWMVFPRRVSAEHIAYVVELAGGDIAGYRETEQRATPARVIRKGSRTLVKQSVFTYYGD